MLLTLAAATVALHARPALATPTCTLSQGTRIYTMIRQIAPQTWAPNDDVGYGERDDAMFVGTYHGFVWLAGASTLPEAPRDWHSIATIPYNSTTACDTAGDCPGSINHSTISRAGDRAALSASCVSRTYVLFDSINRGCGAIGGLLPTVISAGVFANSGSSASTFAFSLGGVSDVSTATAGYRWPTLPVPTFPGQPPTAMTNASEWSVGTTTAMLIGYDNQTTVTISTHAIAAPGTALAMQAFTNTARPVHRLDQQQVDGPPLTLLQDIGPGGQLDLTGPVTLHYADSAGALHATPFSSNGRALVDFRQEGTRLLVHERNAGGLDYLTVWNVADPDRPWQEGTIDTLQGNLARHVVMLQSPVDPHVLWVLSPGDKTFSADGSAADPLCGDPNFMPDFCVQEPSTGYITTAHVYRFRMDCDGVAPGSGDAGTGTDAGAPDAAMGFDAGSTSSDAGGRSDAGDAGNGRIDAGTVGDAGSAGDGAMNGTRAQGCGCSTAGRSRDGATWAVGSFAFGAMLLRGRRKRRSVRARAK